MNRVACMELGYYNNECNHIVKGFLYCSEAHESAERFVWQVALWHFMAFKFLITTLS